MGIKPLDHNVYKAMEHVRKALEALDDTRKTEAVNEAMDALYRAGDALRRAEFE